MRVNISSEGLREWRGRERGREGEGREGEGEGKEGEGEVRGRGGVWGEVLLERYPEYKVSFVRRFHCTYLLAQ